MPGVRAVFGDGTSVTFLARVLMVLAIVGVSAVVIPLVVTALYRIVPAVLLFCFVGAVLRAMIDTLRR